MAVDVDAGRSVTSSGSDATAPVEMEVVARMGGGVAAVLRFNLPESTVHVFVSDGPMPSRPPISTKVWKRNGGFFAAPTALDEDELSAVLLWLGGGEDADLSGRVRIATRLAAALRAALPRMTHRDVIYLLEHAKRDPAWAQYLPLLGKAARRRVLHFGPVLFWEDNVSSAFTFSGETIQIPKLAAFSVEELRLPRFDAAWVISERGPDGRRVLVAVRGDECDVAVASARDGTLRLHVISPSGAVTYDAPPWVDLVDLVSGRLGGIVFAPKQTVFVERADRYAASPDVLDSVSGNFEVMELGGWVYIEPTSPLDGIKIITDDGEALELSPDTYTVLRLRPISKG